MDVLETNLKKEAQVLVRQVREDMYEHIEISESDDVDKIQYYKKINSLRDDFILRETWILCCEMLREKPNPEMKNWNNNYLAFLELRETLNQQPKIVSYEKKDEDSYDDIPDDFIELLSKMKKNLLNTLPNTKDFEPSLEILSVILNDEYLDKGFIHSLYIEEDLAFDIFSFQKRYFLYNKARRIFNEYRATFC